MPRTGDTAQALRTKQPSSPDKLAPREVDWPAPPDPVAFHGLAGDVVCAIDPHTEADPVALLVQFLVAFGSVAGRNAYFVADGTEHYPNVFCVLVGATSKGRKGSAWANVRRVFEQACPDWLSDCIASGLSSGEGLIWAVRDPIEKREPIREKGRFIGE